MDHTIDEPSEALIEQATRLALPVVEWPDPEPCGRDIASIIERLKRAARAYAAPGEPLPVYHPIEELNAVFLPLCIRVRGIEHAPFPPGLIEDLLAAVRVVIAFIEGGGFFPYPTSLGMRHDLKAWYVIAGTCEAAIRVRELLAQEKVIDWDQM